MLVPWRVHLNDQFSQITHVGSFEMVGHHLPGIYVILPFMDMYHRPPSF